jgi:hypothetical protein
LVPAVVRLVSLQRTAAVNSIGGVDERSGLVAGSVNAEAFASGSRSCDDFLVIEERRGAGVVVAAVVAREREKVEDAAVATVTESPISEELLASYNLDDVLCVDLRGRVLNRLCDRARHSSGNEQGTRQDGDDLRRLDRESCRDKQRHPQWKA